MRILSWNINGIRTLPQYHPWNTFKNCQGILDELHADIICFQEMKSTRQALPRDVAIPSNYSSFFSFPIAKGGYSGVAVYTRSDTATPLKAEEGLSGKLQPKPPLTTQERISSRYPSVHDIDTFPDEKGNTPISFDALDSEGRGLVLDFGLFVLINVYCPNETSDARTSFKMNYHLLLEERVRTLIQEGREVIVLGDMNICASPADHCEGHLPSVADTFWEHPARAWFQKWLHPQGPMVDVVRTYWPERKGMFTCWNQKIQARETNYGTRVDYILVTSGLLKWIKHGDIQPSLKGSDHCPIYIDLHDQITLESGEILKLCDAMKQSSASPKLPRIAAKYWSEFKQSQISAFFGKRSSSPIKTKKRAVSPNASGSSPTKRARQSSAEDTIGSGDNQMNPAIASSQAGSSSAADAIEIEGDEEKSNPAMNKGDGLLLTDIDQSLLPDPATAATDCPSTPTPTSTSTPPTPPSSPSKAAWTNLFTPIQPPKCTVHGEPTVKFTVNKAGPNKGRSFYVCSRPVGPGYDKGKESRQWQEVDHKYKCNYFKWASEVKRDNGGPRSPTKR